MDEDLDEIDLCLCFPCILVYIGEYIYPETPESVYPYLARRGFALNEQQIIGEEWFDINVELHVTIIGYVNSDPRCMSMDFGCVWKQPGKRINLDKKLNEREDVLPAERARLVCVVANVVNSIHAHQSTEAFE
jgi:hypothetical protein